MPCCSSNPKSTSYQICVCILICFLSFGSYFCMDNPSALHNEFREDLDMSEVEFMNLYAWYSWPNVVLSFVGGFLIDKDWFFEIITSQRRNSNGPYIQGFWANCTVFWEKSLIYIFWYFLLFFFRLPTFKFKLNSKR